MGWAASYKKFPDSPEIKYRKRFRDWEVCHSSAEEFESILRDLLPKFMPKTFLEGFQECQETNCKDSFFQKTKVIFTSNSHYDNDSFKHYAIDRVDKGAKLIIGQHGGGCLNRYEDVAEVDLLIADKYFSVGNGNNHINDKIVDIGQIFNRQKYNKYNKKGPALLVTVAMPQYTDSLISAVLATQMIKYFEDQFSFYEGLTSQIKNSLKIRLYHGDLKWNQRERWVEKFPNVQFDTNTKLDVAIESSRLFIGTYSATTFNLTLASNIPTIIYWDTNYWQLNKASTRFFDELKRVGIFHDNPASASQQVIKVWDEIDEWWYGSELQVIRERYCRAYAHKPKDLVGEIKNALTSL